MRVKRLNFNITNPLERKGNYSATSNNTKLIHWPLMGGLLHLDLVQRVGDSRGQMAAPCSRTHETRLMFLVQLSCYNADRWFEVCHAYGVVFRKFVLIVIMISSNDVLYYLKAFCVVYTLQIHHRKQAFSIQVTTLVDGVKITKKRHNCTG